MKAEKQVWVVLEAEGQKISPHTKALLREGERIASAVSGALHAIFVGPPIEQLIEDAGFYGVECLHVCVDEGLKHYHPYVYEQAMLAVLGEQCPYLLLALSSSMGSDLMPRISYKLSAPLVTNCLDIEAGAEGGLIFIKPVQKGRLNARVRCKEGVEHMVTVVPESLFISDKPGRPKSKPDLTELPLAGKDTPWPLVPIGFAKADPRTIDISEAETIVALGRGVGSKENYRIMRDFADQVGGAIAGTRPTVDMEMLPHERQIGQTGKRVSPKVIFLFGISGATEFTKGIEGAGTLVAINNDRHAPVFKIADLGILGDLGELTPRILKHLKQTLMQSGN